MNILNRTIKTSYLTHSPIKRVTFKIFKGAYNNIKGLHSNSMMNNSKFKNKNELNNLSKEELIKLVMELQGNQDDNLQNNDNDVVEIKRKGEENFVINNKKKKIKNKEKKEFDMSKYAQRQVALKLAYLGWNYMGLASQGDASMALSLDKLGTKDGLKIDNPDNPKQKIVATVEDYIYKSLLSCKLITDIKDCNFSRCGRTDKGVSGLNQVISIKLRSALSKDILETNNNETEGELPYLDMINKNLPNDIRILAWAPVPKDFNARFDCRSRSYKYFFTTEGANLNIELMKEACSYLVGTHDFRNFCRQDGSKQITVFTRDIFVATIKKADFWFPVDGNINDSDSDHPLSKVKGYELYIKGSGFLWNQIRCIMSILFLVGRKLESPSVIKSLLNTEELNEKPVYELAEPYPLTLFDCSYDIDFKWQVNTKTDTNSLTKIFKITYKNWYESLTKAYHFSNVLRTVHQLAPSGYPSFEKNDPASIPIILGAGHNITTRNYVPLLKRNRASSVEVRNQRYRDKMLRKQKAEIEGLKEENTNPK